MVGTLVHELLAFHYAAKCDTPPSWYVGKELWTPEQQIDAIGAREQVAQRTTALDVFHYYKSQTVGEPWQPLYVEQEFSATLGELDPGGPFPELDGEVVTCRSDLVVRINGETVIVDHKCLSGEFGRDRLPDLALSNEYSRSLQVQTNLALVSLHERRLGRPPATGFMIQRIKRKQPFDLRRDPIDVPVGALEETGRVLRHLVRQELVLIEQFKIDHASVVPNPSQCATKYGLCDYGSICNATRADRPDVIRAEYGIDSPSW